MRTNDACSVQMAGYRGVLSQSYHDPAFQQWLEELLRSQFTSYPPLRRARAREVYRLDSVMGEVYVKRYRVQTVKHGLRARWHTHAAQKSWRIARFLLRQRIPTPQPVAYLAHWTSLFSGEQILLTEGISGGISLAEYINHNLAGSRLTVREKRQLLQRVAEFVGRLHRIGVYHGDFTAENILVTPLSNGDFRVYLIDLDGVRSTRWISTRRRIKNLDELGRNFLDLRVISTADRARFLKHYVRVYAKETRPFHHLFRLIWQRTQYRVQKHHTPFIGSR
ncbi:hypothetical protein GF339_07900 [candidate division KSB3 bacterium]|uniref:Protein kinase domain-containing protein n=1 Tax=candidate division KSB3 bacterium TaxID=2044937 RepID=A0A9D5Q5M4_9BACT|nr:hypothetical protein [candidate division KSB3 bacterium]MBD3324493.1 hypothetical protein [candidate division KSB3 bacterium]